MDFCVSEKTSILIFVYLYASQFYCLITFWFHPLPTVKSYTKQILEDLTVNSKENETKKEK